MQRRISASAARFELSIVAVTEPMPAARASASSSLNERRADVLSLVARRRRRTRSRRCRRRGRAARSRPAADRRRRRRRPRGGCESSAANAASSVGERHGLGPRKRIRRERSPSRAKSAATVSVSPFCSCAIAQGRPEQSGLDDVCVHLRLLADWVGESKPTRVSWKSQPTCATLRPMDDDDRPRRAPLRPPSSVVGEKWSLLVIRELALGRPPLRRDRRYTGAPRDILTSRLRRLESVGVVERRQYQERPPRYGYHLTRSGHELRPVLLSLMQWGDRWAVDGAVGQLRAHVRPRARARPHVPRLRRRGDRLRPEGDVRRARVEQPRAGRARSRLDSPHDPRALRAEPDGLAAPRQRAERRRQPPLRGRARRHVPAPHRRHRRRPQRRRRRRRDRRGPRLARGPLGRGAGAPERAVRPPPRGGAPDRRAGRGGRAAVRAHDAAPRRTARRRTSSRARSTISTSRSRT